MSLHSIHFFLEMLEAKEALVTNREADLGLMKCSDKWLPRHVAHVGAELWALYVQPGSALASGCSSLSPLPLFSWQAARSNLWYARNFPMVQLSSTISVALKLKCQSGKGHAILNRAPRREYHSLEQIKGEWVEKPVWRRVKFLPLYHSQVRVPCHCTQG